MGSQQREPALFITQKRIVHTSNIYIPCSRPQASCDQELVHLDKLRVSFMFTKFIKQVFTRKIRHLRKFGPHGCLAPQVETTNVQNCFIRIKKTTCSGFRGHLIGQRQHPTLSLVCRVCTPHALKDSVNILEHKNQAIQMMGKNKNIRYSNSNIQFLNRSVNSIFITRLAAQLFSLPTATLQGQQLVNTMAH